MNKQQLLETLNHYGIKVFSLNDIKILLPNESYLATDLKRMADNNVITRIAKGYYVLANFLVSSEEIAQKIYNPSYISFESALYMYGIINQGPNEIFLATTKRTKSIKILDTIVKFRHLKQDLFFGFLLQKNIFIAEPEKAVLDTLYFYYKHETKVDVKAWYLKNLNLSKLKVYSTKFGRGFCKYLASQNLTD